MLWLVKKPFILIADLFSSLLQWIFYPSKQQAVELTTPPPKLKFTETIKKLNKKRVANHFCLPHLYTPTNVKRTNFRSNWDGRNIVFDE